MFTYTKRRKEETVLFNDTLNTFYLWLYGVSIPREGSHIQKMDSETDFSNNSNYDEFANEISFVSDILQPYQFEPVFTAAEIQAKKT